MVRLLIFTFLAMAVHVNGAKADLILNEYLADPNFLFDANGDGVFTKEADEFVELVNDSVTTSIDLSNWSYIDIDDAFTTRHIFAPGTILLPGQALVLFGGGTPTGDFGGSLVFTASSGSLLLTETGETFQIRDDNNNVVISHTIISDEVPAGISYTRNPDITGAFAASNTLGDPNLRGTPGFRNDGSLFVAIPEPATGGIAALLCAGLVIMKRRRNR